MISDEEIRNFLIEWASKGIRFENYLETDTEIKLYISVPETSYKKNEDGTDLAGNILASKFNIKAKEFFTSDKKLLILRKTRVSEHFDSISEKLNLMRLELLLSKMR